VVYNLCTWHADARTKIIRKVIVSRYPQIEDGGATCKGSAAFLLSTAFTVCLAQSSTATDPKARAKEIAALSPAKERQDLRKAEVKDLSVVMSGVEKILRANIQLVLDIWQFHEKKIPSVSRMRYMHRNAPEQIAEALSGLPDQAGRQSSGENSFSGNFR